MRRFVVIAASVLFFASEAGAQQFPILDAIANKVIQKYQNSSCPQLMAQRDQPRGPEERGRSSSYTTTPRCNRPSSTEWPPRSPTSFSSAG